MNVYQLPPLPRAYDVLNPSNSEPIALFTVKQVLVYAEAAVAPLLQDLAAHEASNRIKTENLETLREQNAKLREALEVVATWPITGKPSQNMDAHNMGAVARAALGESDG